MARRKRREAQPDGKLEGEQESKAAARPDTATIAQYRHTDKDAGKKVYSYDP